MTREKELEVRLREVEAAMTRDGASEALRLKRDQLLDQLDALLEDRLDSEFDSSSDR